MASRLTTLQSMRSLCRFLFFGLACTFLAPGAQAACSETLDAKGNPLLTCSEAGTAPLADTRDRLAIAVQPEASVQSASRDQAAIRLSGTDNTVVNEGLVANTDTRSNAHAIEGRGANLTIDNRGRIESGDRAVHILDGAAGFTLFNSSDAVISARRQTIRSDDETASADARVENHGLIESLSGRAIQLRGRGSTVINYGTLTGGEEVVEGRVDFTLENDGSIRVRDGVSDEDGAQFSSGSARNRGLIQGSDDGLDIDEGLIHNHVGGRIISTNPNDTRDSAGIDADPVLQIPGLHPSEHPQAGLLTVVNEGLIAGPRAIGADAERTGAINVINSGTLRGYHGVSLDYAPGMLGSELILFGASEIFGDVLFGGGDDVVTLGELASGLIIEGVFDGGAGLNRVVLEGYDLGSLRLFQIEEDFVSMVISTTSGELGAQFRHFHLWQLGGEVFTAAALAALVPSPAPVPLPAALPLLLGACGFLLSAARPARGTPRA